MKILKDVKASFVVSLVALPLCLGISLASGAPLSSGLISGIVAGILIGLLGGSAVSVSGPAAGLSVLVATQISSLGNFSSFLIVIIIMGLLQILFSILRLGFISQFIPSSVIKGMLASIGIIIILKQIPHLFGYDKDFIGDVAYQQPDGHNTINELYYMFNKLHMGAFILSIISISFMLFWDKWVIKKFKQLAILPGALIVVTISVLINKYLLGLFSFGALSGEHLVQIPNIESLLSFPHFNEWSLEIFKNLEIYKMAVFLALIATIETLLNLDALEKIDPHRRPIRFNRELFAQGLANITCGFLGGIPVTSVIVRSSANINADAQTNKATIFHGLILLFSILLLPGVLNEIPLCALAVILVTVGFKLTSPSIYKATFLKGMDQLFPFIFTILACIFIDLLTGVILGWFVGLFFVMKKNYHSAIICVHEDNNYLIKFNKDVSFMHKIQLRSILVRIPANSHLQIDGSNSVYIDHDVIEMVDDFIDVAKESNINVIIKKSSLAIEPYFKTATQEVS